MPENNEPKKQYETGHAKLLESFDELIALSGTLDQTKLNPPTELTLVELGKLKTRGALLFGNVGNSRTDWRTVALARAVIVDKFEAVAAQAVGQLAGRGASKETVKDARGYVRKLQGKRSGAKTKDDPATPNFDESEKSISASQQSNAAKIATFYELIDFLEVQPEYAGVTAAGMVAVDLRALADSAQAKHEESLVKFAALADDLRERNKVFYFDENNICEIARRFKELVKGTYGAKSPEYKEVFGIKFVRPKI